MGKTLIIAEKPSVAADIAQALGGFSKGNGHYERSDAIVANARGHLIEIFAPEADKGGKSLAELPIIPAQFGLRPTKDAGPQLRHLLNLLNDPSITEVVNACDAGREGELIFRLIYDYAKSRKPMKRMWLQSMTTGAIKEAWADLKPGAQYQGLGDAARCRSEADWIVGINGTRGVTRLHERQNGTWEMMAVGRVQTPTLSLVVERERAIKSFAAKDYWEVHGTFSVAAGTYSGTWLDAKAKPEPSEKNDDDDTEPTETSAAGRIFDKKTADAIVAKCQGITPSKVTEEAKRSEEAPQRLLDLTTLQREANKRYKYSAKKTLDIAQALYETHKVTTYPRTDSTALPEDYVEKAQQLMGTFSNSSYAAIAQAVINGNWVRPVKRIFDNSEITDHFAIIPTGTAPNGLSPEEQNIYDLITRRFIAAFYPNAVYMTTTRITTVAEEKFRTSGRVTLEQGWRVVWNNDQKTSRGTPPALCAYQDGEAVRNKSVTAVGAKTRPPARYTEASLLGAMSNAGKTIDDTKLRAAIRESGLGTPATRASIIEGLLSTGTKEKPKQPYMQREGKEQHLVPTEKGDGLYGFLTSNSMSELTSAMMTAEWETKLLQVQKGQLERRNFMHDIGQSARDMIDVLRSKAQAMPESAQHSSQTPCPKCQGQLRGQRKLECGCGFSIWTTVLDRPLTPNETNELLTKRRTGLLKGFYSNKTKRKFDAILVLKDDFSTGFEFAENPSNTAPGATAETKILEAPCPKCKGALRFFGGEKPRYACTNADFTFWMTLAQRRFSDDEAQEIIQNGHISPVFGFVSNKNKKFGAGVKLSKDLSRVEFVFEE